MSKINLTNLLKQNLLKVDKKFTSFSNVFGDNQKQSNDQNIDDIINTINYKKNNCKMLLDKKKMQIGGSDLIDNMDNKLERYNTAFNELHNIYDQIESDKNYRPDYNKIDQLTEIMDNIENNN